MIRNLVPASNLVGEMVHSKDGKIDGQIEEVIVDTENAKIAYALISFDRQSGLGEKWIAFPWEGIHMDLSQGGDGLILEATKESLRSAPRFTPSNWPNFADPQFAVELYDHFGMRVPQNGTRTIEIQ